MLFARRHIRVLSIGDRIAHSYFQDVSPRRNFDFLGLVCNFLRLASLHAVHEYQGPDGRTDHNQFGRIGCMGFAMKPAAARDAKQQENEECLQWSTFGNPQNKQRITACSWLGSDAFDQK